MEPVLEPGSARLLHGDVTETIIRVFYDVYNELGSGFLENIYHQAMLIALRQAGLTVESEFAIPVVFRGNEIGSYKGDLLVENIVLLELKAARNLDSAHEAQLLHYLRATSIEIGLLLNFGEQPKFKRLLFDNKRKAARNNP